MTPGHRGASGLPSGWLDDPLGATVFRPVALGPLRVEMPTCCWLFCLGVRPDGDDADEHLALVIKTVLSQEREKHQAFSLPPSGIPQRDSKGVGVIFAWTTHPPNGRLHEVTCHGKKTELL